jgi:guanine deaminase
LIQMMHEEFLRKALTLALQNVRACVGGPFAAVIVQDGTIIAEGCNEVTWRNDPTAHAEVVAIRRACKTLGTFDLSSCELYTSCEPCPMCAGAIHWARLRKVYYAATRDDAARAGFDDARMHEEVARPLDARSIPHIQLSIEDVSAAFEEWAKSPNKVRY